MWKEKEATVSMDHAWYRHSTNSFHIIEWLFHKVLSILTFLPNMTLEMISIVWSIIASISIVIIWSIAKL